MYICRPIDVSDQGLLLKPAHPHQRTAGYTLINIHLSLSLLPTTTLPCVLVNHCYHYEQYDHNPVRAEDQGGEVTGRLALPQQTASPPRRPQAVDRGPPASGHLTTTTQDPRVVLEKVTEKVSINGCYRS